MYIYTYPIVLNVVSVVCNPRDCLLRSPSRPALASLAHSVAKG